MRTRSPGASEGFTPPAAFVTRRSFTPSAHRTRAPKATSSALHPSYPWARPCIAATGTAAPSTESSPTTSRAGRSARFVMVTSSRRALEEERRRRGRARADPERRLDPGRHARARLAAIALVDGAERLALLHPFPDALPDHER